MLEMGGNEDEAIGALLHDVVEDGGGPAARAHIAEQFGEGVALIVDANTDTDENRSRPGSSARPHTSSRSLARPSALRVSLADKVHNASAITRDYKTHGEALGADSRRARARRCAGITGRSRTRSSSGETTLARMQPEHSPSYGGWLRRWRSHRSHRTEGPRPPPAHRAARVAAPAGARWLRRRVRSDRAVRGQPGDVARADPDRGAKRQLAMGDGGELKPGPNGQRPDAHAAHSSAALAFNAFGRWLGY